MAKCPFSKFSHFGMISPDSLIDQPESTSRLVTSGSAVVLTLSPEATYSHRFFHQKKMDHLYLQKTPTILYNLIWVPTNYSIYIYIFYKRIDQLSIASESKFKSESNTKTFVVSALPRAARASDLSMVSPRLVTVQPLASYASSE